MKNHRTTVSLVLATLIIGFLLGLFFYPKVGKLQYTKEDISALQDTIKVWKDKDGKNHAKISVLEYESTKHFLDLDTKKGEIWELQQLVKEYKKKLKNKGSVTIITDETVYEEEKKKIPDKAFRGLSIFDTISNNYVWSSFGFKNDSSYFKLKVYNKYSLIIAEESQGWFKPNKTYVEVINDNPYTETKGVRTFLVSQKPKKWGLGPNVSLGYNGEFKPYIGFGVQYNLMQW